MPIDRFNLERFAAALPAPKNGQTWQHLGIIQGEHCFHVQPFPDVPVGLFVRSSVKADGWAADTAEDSIRVGWCEPAPPYKFIGNKAKCYTTRVAGWETRMVTLIRKLAAAAHWCRPCPKCGTTLTPFTAKAKENGNAGRCFVSCSQCKNGDRSAVFYWCEDEDGAPLPVSPDLLPKPPAPPKPPEPAARMCPQCGTAAVMPSKFGGAGAVYCFPRLGGCGWKGTETALAAPAGDDHPAARPEPTPAPAAAEPAPVAVPVFSPPPPRTPADPGRYSGPLTLPALVGLVEDMITVLHESPDALSLEMRLRSEPACGRVATFIQQFRNPPPAGK